MVLLVFIVLMLLVFGTIPLRVVYLTQREGSICQWRPKLSKKSRTRLVFILLLLYVIISIKLGKINASGWILISIIWSYVLYIAIAYLADKDMVLPHGVLYSGKNLGLRITAFLFSLIMLVVLAII